jgi:hypothetical protein
MKAFSFLSFVLCMCIVSAANAGGFANNDDFVVLTATEDQDAIEPDGDFAQRVMVRASELRKQIATEWLGDEIPSGVGRTHLTVLLTASEDTGRTWERSSLTRGYHSVHVSTTQKGALGGTLAHEIAHVVLSTRFPQPQLSPWVAEGIASQYDEQDRVEIRRQILKWYISTDNWPDLEQLLRRETIPAAEQEAYATSASLTAFLLTKGDKSTFLKFAIAGTRDGWDVALNSNYEIHDVDELSTQWKDWARRQLKTDATTVKQQT